MIDEELNLSQLRSGLSFWSITSNILQVTTSKDGSKSFKAVEVLPIKCNVNEIILTINKILTM